MRELRQAGVTVFLNSHFLSEVEVTCDRVAIVKKGRVVRLGTLAELTRQTTEVELRAAGLTPEVEAGLAQWGRIVQRTTLAATDRPGPAMPPDALRLILAVAGEDVLPHVAAYLIHVGAQVYTLAPQRLSLEDLFMRVMQEET